MNRTISYDRATRDFRAEVDGILIGFYGSYHAAEVACDEYVYQSLARLAPLSEYEMELAERMGVEA